MKINCWPVLSVLCLSLWAVSVQGNAQKIFTVMSYNVENLFDTVHDEGKNDWEYLPLEFKKTSLEQQEYCKKQSGGWWKIACMTRDWSEQVLQKKIANISRVIKSFDNGRAADIVVLQEVENINVLQMLHEKGLKNQGFKTVLLLEGPDRRGIDVAIMGRFPLVKGKKSKLYDVPLYKESANGKKKRKYTRGILEATFNVWGKEVTILANHWPSPGNPAKFRNETAQIMRSIAARDPHRAIIATGDFNTLPDDNPNGLDNWITSNDFLHTFLDPLKHIHHELPFPGSHWYKGNWSHLDRIFVWNDSSSSGVHPLWESFQVVVHPWMLHDINVCTKSAEQCNSYEDVPMRFDDRDGGKGYSDHLPIAMSFALED